MISCLFREYFRHEAVPSTFLENEEHLPVAFRLPVYQQDILIIDIVDPYRFTLGLTKNDDKAGMLVNSSLLFFCDKEKGWNVDRTCPRQHEESIET